MQRSLKKLLWDADHAASLAISAASSHTIDDYLIDEFFRGGLHHQLQVVGERAGVAVYAPEAGSGSGDPVKVARDSIEFARRAQHARAESRTPQHTELARGNIGFAWG